MKTLAIINQKGGVGKSTTTANLGAGLILKGFKVLLIELDPQGNLSYSMKADSNSLTSLELLTHEFPVKKIIQHTEQGDIIPATPALSGADNLIKTTGKEYRLKEAIDSIKDNYDYIIIDTPPALGILTINALSACSGVIIPTQADSYSLQGIGQLNVTIETVRKYCNSALKINGILITRYNNRTILSRNMADMIAQTAKQIHTKLYKTYIRECIAIKEAQATQQNIFNYAPKSNGSIDYRSLIKEILLEKEL